ncbi:hypothetical protein [Janthinobacterium fluminis]|uniref:HD domain-containing protein n=1 Tax=Janthinobacterium fluminis TaxID=2987524 RepID=A0ABT5K2Z0_9BURK|nr:hypothetical protein [Janthinobacterium fluminis]MDC8759045.1 hypothetical protein [Janthinobacterium fluminis]
MNVIQKYTRALGSSNLRDDAHHHSTEVLAAAALCHDLGTKLFRVKYAGDATSYPALLEAWREVVITKAAHRTWPADVSPAKVARLSLDHWLNDVCLACTGRGYEPVRGKASTMSDVPCVRRRRQARGAGEAQPGAPGRGYGRGVGRHCGARGRKNDEAPGVGNGFVTPVRKTIHCL